MSAELRPIHDRSRRAYLSEADAINVELGVLTWNQAVQEREERVQIELRELRRINAGLAADNQHLASDNDAVRDRLAHAERMHSLWLGGLALVTVAAVIVAVSMIR